MVKKKEEWISAQEAAKILTRNTDHEIAPDYVRILALKSGKIAFRARDGRTNEYRLSDVEDYHIRPKHTPRIRPRPSTRKVPMTEV